jgi:hypothetical protein
MRREAAHPAKNTTRTPKAVLWLMRSGLPELAAGDKSSALPQRQGTVNCPQLQLDPSTLG